MANEDLQQQLEIMRQREATLRQSISGMIEEAGRLNAIQEDRARRALQDIEVAKQLERHDLVFDFSGTIAHSLLYIIMGNVTIEDCVRALDP